MSKKILLIGCGELGSRHLQAVAVCKGIKDIEVVDLNPRARLLGQKRLKEIKVNPAICISWSAKLEDATGDGDLCIVATQAEGRGEIIEFAAKKLGYKKFLVEKIVVSSVRRYKKLLTFAKNNGISAWVNCKSRGYKLFKYIKSRLDPNEPIVFSVIGGNYGLATNGIHLADLFVFFDGTQKILPAGERIDPILHPSKRGKHLFELSGSLYGYTKKGSDFTLSFAKDHRSPDCLSVTSPRRRFWVDYLNNMAFESDATNGWKWKCIWCEDNILVSHMTKGFMADILSKNRCDLPTLAECFPAHEFILSRLQPHFNRLLKRQKFFCPVT